MVFYLKTLSTLFLLINYTINKWFNLLTLLKMEKEEEKKEEPAEEMKGKKKSKKKGKGKKPTPAAATATTPPMSPASGRRLSWGKNKSKSFTKSMNDMLSKDVVLSPKPEKGVLRKKGPGPVVAVKERKGVRRSGRLEG